MSSLLGVVLGALDKDEREVVCGGLLEAREVSDRIGFSGSQPGNQETNGSLGGVATVAHPYDRRVSSSCSAFSNRERLRRLERGI